MNTCKCGCGKVVRGHLTFTKGHRLLVPEPMLFWREVKFTGSCWLWRGKKTPEGYGQFRTGRRKEGTYRFILAHRWAYEYLVGPIPQGLQIDHLCRTPLCVNPAHLEPVTIRENVLRGVGITAQLAKVTQCPQGHPYSGDNLYRSPQGARYCRKCRTQHYREWYYRDGQEWFQQRYLKKKRAALHSSRST